MPPSKPGDGTPRRRTPGGPTPKGECRERLRPNDDTPVDITSTARDRSTRSPHVYLAVPYDIPRGCAAGCMPETNVLCALADHSTRSDQPIMKHLRGTVERSAA